MYKYITIFNIFTNICNYYNYTHKYNFCYTYIMYIIFKIDNNIDDKKINVVILFIYCVSYVRMNLKFKICI